MENGEKVTLNDLINETKEETTTVSNTTESTPQKAEYLDGVCLRPTQSTVGVYPCAAGSAAAMTSPCRPRAAWPRQAGNL